MPDFQPFHGLRYDEAIDMNATCSPPYDVIGEAERVALAARTPYNVVHIDLPIPGDEVDNEDPYLRSARLLQEWQDDKVLVTDDELSFYIYRMGFHDDQGRARQTTGVIGALTLTPPTDGHILPHEQTTPKAKSDRLDLLRTTHANLSPIWGLSLAEGLTELCEVPGPPVARATDALGVHHRLWKVTSPGILDAISQAVASAPIVLADGHHRFETSLAYRDERRDAVNGTHGGYDATMALVIELTESQLSVQAIHRLFRGLPALLHEPDALLAALDPYFEAFDAGVGAPNLLTRMDDATALGLVLSNGHSWLLRPRLDAFPDNTPDLDSARLQVATAAVFPQAEVTYQHGIEHILNRVTDSDEGFDIGVLLRPVGVAQIAACAHGGDRMPPKSTYFYPKPLTGMVFRSLDL
ncbi:MAG: DUF1015 family protein [Acidimicrobiales bacterium]